MRAVKKCCASCELLDDFRHASAHFILILEPLLPLFHLSAQICAGVEPEASRILRLITGGVQVVELIRQPIQRIGVERGNLAGLETTEQHSRAVDAAYSRLCVY